MATNIVVPELGESVVEATVARWLKAEGQRVAVGEALVELETEKVDLEVGATRDGVLARIERKEGENVRIGELLGVIEEAAASDADSAGEARAPEQEAAPREPAPPREAQPPEAGRRRATPSARRLAREREIDLGSVPGSGESGRVTREDVERFAAPKPPAPDREAAPSREPRPGPTLVQPPPAEGPPAPRRDGETRPEERVRMSRRRQTIARRLVEAQQTAAMLTTFNEIDMSGVVAVRQRQKEPFEQRYGVKLGLTSFFVKAAVAALKAFPRLNAEIQGTEMVLKKYYDIGIAVGAAEGLVVPVLRDADRMSFAEIERAVKDFVRKADAGELTLEDLRGGSFTITNGGIYGSLLSTPILNPPQVGILGLHKIEDRAVPDEGTVAIRPMMYVALSYDHRIVDGLEAVQFLVRIKQLVEDPEGLLLG